MSTPNGGGPSNSNNKVHITRIAEASECVSDVLAMNDTAGVGSELLMDDSDGSAMVDGAIQFDTMLDRIVNSLSE